MNEFTENEIQQLRNDGYEYIATYICEQRKTIEKLQEALVEAKDIAQKSLCLVHEMKGKMEVYKELYNQERAMCDLLRMDSIDE